MWAFMPANANWSGAIPRRERSANSGAQARGTLAGSLSYASTAAKNRPANPMSRPAMNCGSPNTAPPSSELTPSVTSR